MIDSKKDPEAFIKEAQENYNEAKIEQLLARAHGKVIEEEIRIYYARVGPSWIVSMMINFEEPIPLRLAVSYALKNPWRKIQIIGKSGHLFIDNDKELVMYRKGEWKDPYTLTVGGKKIKGDCR